MLLPMSKTSRIVTQYAKRWERSILAREAQPTNSRIQLTRTIPGLEGPHEPCHCDFVGAAQRKGKMRRNIRNPRRVKEKRKRKKKTEKSLQANVVTFRPYSDDPRRQKGLRSQASSRPDLGSDLRGFGGWRVQERTCASEPDKGAKAGGAKSSTHSKGGWGRRIGYENTN
jgi:hypothetical protein